jgi:hypothetical protein
MSSEPVSKEAAVKEQTFTPNDLSEAAPVAKVEAGSLPTSCADTADLNQEARSVRWLLAHYPLSQAEANIIAAELGWLEAA